MSAPRPGETGATRTCPHCKTTILESAAVCPACRGHLRLDATAPDPARRFVPLRVEGTVEGAAEGAFEYTLLAVVRNERGEEIARQVLAVGAVFPGEARHFELSVEATRAPPDAPPRRRLRH